MIMSREFDWDSIVVPTSLSLKEEINLTIAESKYHLNNNNNARNNDFHKSKSIRINELDTDYLPKIEKITLTEVWELIQKGEEVLTNPRYKFPKLKKINDLFSTLLYLDSQNFDESKLKILNKSEHQEIYNSLLYFNLFEEDQNSTIEYTEKYVLFKEKSTVDEKYKYFITLLGEKEAIRNSLSLQIQINSFDSLTKDLIKGYLMGDLNFMENKKELNIAQLINQLRSWYLEVKKTLMY